MYSQNVNEDFSAEAELQDLVPSKQIRDVIWEAGAGWP